MTQHAYWLVSYYDISRGCWRNHRFYGELGAYSAAEYHNARADVGAVHIWPPDATTPVEYDRLDRSTR